MTNDSQPSRRKVLAGAVVSAVGSLGGWALASEQDKRDGSTGLPDYSRRFQSLRITRSDSGVVMLRLHTNDKPFRLTFEAYSELPEAFQEISVNPQNRVLIVTGTGDSFIEAADLSTFGDLSTSLAWQSISARARRAIQSFVDIDIPVVAAVNGPARLHSELALLADIVIAADDAWFEDPHLAGGIAPGDGTHLAWIELLGLNRARSMLLMKDRLTAKTCFDLGLVRELKSRDQVLSRATEIASQLAQLRPSTLRATRQALTHRLRRLMAEGLAVGWSAEALSAWR